MQVADPTSRRDALRDHVNAALPIFQAPVGSVASPALAAAVSNAGGIGHLAATWRTPDQLRIRLAATDALTARPYGVNFVLGFPIDELLGVALDHGASIISFFWGDGSSLLPRVWERGALAMQVVSSIEGAKRAADAGFDFVVAQGREAGGHVHGELGTFSLLPQVVDACRGVPVIAGGGIADARGVAAAFALGARGVWVGTGFLAANEADIHPHYRERLLAASGDDTVYSALFDVGWPDAPMRRFETARCGSGRGAADLALSAARVRARRSECAVMAVASRDTILARPTQTLPAISKPWRFTLENRWDS